MQRDERPQRVENGRASVETAGESFQRRSAPSLALPKGGGALRGIDEKFTVNALNGTCDLAVSLPFSKTRSGVDGSVALQYSSGSGNSLFGLGWSLRLPSISRKTDRRLPEYEDARESDVFLLSGAEDLVPAYFEQAPGDWQRDAVHQGNAHSERYRPRIEGAFARVEKISIDGERGFFWKVTTPDNVVTIFGRTANARIADPRDDTRIFRWLPQWTYDDKGNCAEFVYKPEDLANVPDVIEEKNRREPNAFANSHLKRIRYGNTNPYFPDALTPFNPAAPVNAGYLFETVFDYGEHHADAPTPADNEAGQWPCRFDPFSEYRAGFDIRTYRLCRRVLFYHSFTELNVPPAPQPQPCLVRSVDLTYQHFHFDGAPHRREETELLLRVDRLHYRKTGAAAYARRSIPPLDLHYHSATWNTNVQSVSPQDIVHVPAGIEQSHTWVDLDGFGVPGILTEDAAAWYYKRNEGQGHFSRAAAVTPKPTLQGTSVGLLQFRDLDADGRRQVVSTQPGLHGYYELDDDDLWQPFRAFEQAPPVDMRDPNVRLLDLDGDGKADLLISEEIVFRWYPSLGTRGYDAPKTISKSFDEERGPALVFADGEETIFVADMNGDGLADIVRVRNGEVCYWPNTGHGRFGAKVTMANAPVLDRPEQFDPRAIQLADISGTGAADLVYLGRGGFVAWLNLSGNGWSAAQPIDPFPGTERPNRVAVLDILGNGTACLVWSSELPANQSTPIRYVDLMSGRKPYILDRYANNLGMETRLEYRSSAYYALLDRREGRPWITKLPFPTMCVSRSEVRDSVSGTLFVREYRYRHGYYDHAEREFRGFGMVEERDGESFDRFSKSGASNVVPAPLHQPPARTRTWYHTGAFERGVKILHAFADDYFQNTIVPEHDLPELIVEGGPLTPREMREAARACKGTMLRREVYADDGSLVEELPFTTSTHNCHVRRIQPARGETPAVFIAQQSESLTYHYERDLSDPRTTHTLNTRIDEVGNVVESAMVVYGRRIEDLALPQEVRDEQNAVRIIYTAREYTNDIRTNVAYRLRRVAQTASYELTGAAPAASYFTPAELRALFTGSSPLEFEESPHNAVVERRLIDLERTRFASDADPNLPLAFNALDPIGLHYQSYRLAFTPTLLASLYGGDVTAPMLTEGDYIQIDGRWWVRSGTVQYPLNPRQHFYLPDRYTDAHGATSAIRYHGASHLLIDRTEDALGNRIEVLAFDFRVLEPRTLRDANDNITDTVFDILGLVAGIAHRGKGAEADELAGFVPDLSQAETDAFFADPVGQGANLLQHATSRFIYRFGPLPAVAATIDRETNHRTAVDTGVPSRLRYTFEYSDGLGHIAMQKMQAEPGIAKQVTVNPDGTYTVANVDTTPNRRWVGNGRKILDNRGNRVMEYEPYFSATHGYETAAELVESGVTPLYRYDPIGRLIRIEYPDGSFERVAFDAWQQRTYDQNDGVVGSDWYNARIGGALGTFERDAALKSAVHDGTPSVVHSDSLGRPVFLIEHNRFEDRTTGALRNETYTTFTKLDIEGNRLFIRDPRGLQVLRWSYDYLGRANRVASMDAGEMRSIVEATGKPLYTWDADASRFRTVYDVLLRPTRREVLPPAAAAPIVIERSEYGNDTATNANLKLIRHYDGGGIATHGPFDFRGNVLRTRRELTDAAASVVDWTNPATVAVRAPLTLENRYDALDRVVRSASPDGSVTMPVYSEANLLGSLSVSVRGGAPRTFIRSITHNEKGQRLRIEYSESRMATDVTYDPITYRTRRIRTTRTSDGALLQDLNYTYDPEGNVTFLRDLALQNVYFSNAIVEPHNDYTYDAVYRLVRATGRELIGLDAPVSRRDSERTGLVHRSDLNAMRRYLQQYEYDDAGNMTRMVHSAGSGPFAHRWTRELTPRMTNNQLVSSQVGMTNEPYTYDVRGNVTSMPGLPDLTWDVMNRLGEVDLGGGGTAHYAYDTDGQRVKKVVDHGGGLIDERVYVGALEVYTRTLGGVLQLRRETLHILDGTQRLAMIDTRVDGLAPVELIRFQFSNHVETASLELDDQAQVITYEEYYPFGSTSYQASDATRDVPAKRYRYTSRERDEETGLYYHGARYYAPWLARWTAPDPSGVQDGANRYAYVNNHPTRLLDRTGRDGSEGSWWSRHGARVVGGLQVVGGVLEIAAGAAGLAAPTGVTQVLGAVAVVHGTDTLLTGLHTLISGQVQETVTQQAASGTARALGASESTAQTIGTAVDFTAGVVPSAGVGIARAVATRTAVEVTTQTAVHTAPQAVVHAAPAVAVEATTHAVPAAGVQATTHAVPSVVTHAAPSVATHTAPSVVTHAAPTVTRTTVTATARQTATRAAVRTATGTGARGAGRRTAHRILAEGGESALRVRIVDTLTRTIARQNIRLARAVAQRDIAYLRNLGLSQRAINRLFQGPGSRLYAAIYGQALERSVVRAVRSSPFLSQFFEFIGSRAGFVAGRGRPDFRGIGIMQGILADLTTLAGRSAHYARSYGERMLVLTYAR